MDELMFPKLCPHLPDPDPGTKPAGRHTLRFITACEQLPQTLGTKVKPVLSRKCLHIKKKNIIICFRFLFEFIEV